MQDILFQAGLLIAVILLGYLLRRFRILPKDAFFVVSRLVMRVTLPCVVIRNFAHTTMEPAFLFVILIGFICMALFAGLGYLINRKRGVNEQIFDMLNLTGFNIGCFALPFISGLLGPSAVIAVCMFDAGSALGATGGLAVVCRSMQDNSRFQIRTFLKRFSKAFLTHVYIVMVILRLLSVEIPDVIVRFCDLCGSGNSFLSMLMIGLGMSLVIPKSGRRWLTKAFLIRYGIAIALSVCFWLFLPFDVPVRLGAAIAVLAPVSSLNPAFIEECGGDYELASSWNTVSILSSLVFITLALLLAAGFGIL